MLWRLLRKQQLSLTGFDSIRAEEKTNYSINLVWTRVFVCNAVRAFLDALTSGITIGGSNCLHHTSAETRRSMISGCQTVIVRIIALRIVSNLRIQATKATFLALPASTRRW